MVSNQFSDCSDSELLEQVAKGDQEAFERLYRTYEQRLYGYVWSLLRDDPLAQDIIADVTGDVMVAVWKESGQFQARARVSTWIFGIARHKAVDYLRRKSSRHHTISLDEFDAAEEGQESPEEVITRKGRAILTQKALEELSPKHREILYLVFFEELPYKEISHLIGIPINTVKSRVFNAKEHLKHILDRLDPASKIS